MVKDIQVIVLFSAVSPLCIKDNIQKKNPTKMLKYLYHPENQHIPL